MEAPTNTHTLSFCTLWSTYVEYTYICRFYNAVWAITHSNCGKNHAAQRKRPIFSTFNMYFIHMHRGKETGKTLAYFNDSVRVERANEHGEHHLFRFILVRFGFATIHTHTHSEKTKIQQWFRIKRFRGNFFCQILFWNDTAYFIHLRLNVMCNRTFDSPCAVCMFVYGYTFARSRAHIIYTV